MEENLYGPEMVRGMEQVQHSRGLIEKLKRETWEDVSKIRSDADIEENRRRVIEDKQRAERYEIIQDEAIQTSKQNEAVEMRWQDLAELEECDELNQKIEEQKRECEAILSKKQKLIDEFVDELKAKDAFYIKQLRKQEEAIDELIAKMRNQYRDMRKTYREQLQEIEEALLREREDLLNHCKKEIDEKFDEHKLKEAGFNHGRQELEDKQAMELDDVRSREASDYQNHKIQQETDLQIVEKCLEDMKAIYQLNTEKLTYNTRVLKEKKTENDQEKAILTSRERKLRERMAWFRKLYLDKEKEYNRDNATLTDEFKKATRAFRELQKKYKHFEKDDTLRYQEIFEMNAAEARTLGKKILKCDRTIYLQQLGLPWVQPEDAEKLVEEEEAESSEAKEQEQAERQSSHRSPSTTVSVQKIRQVFTMLVDECAFLVEDKVRDQCHDKQDKECLTLKIDSIRKTLGVETMEDVELLVNTFYQNTEDLSQDSSGSLEPDVLEVDPNDIIDLLFQFREAKEAHGGGATASKSHESGGITHTPARSQTRDEKEKQGPSFWERMVALLPESHLRTWKVLVKTFQNYYSLLQNRQQLVEETGVLHQQNEELRALLKQYLEANVNQELIVPPTQMIKFDEAEEEQ